MNIETLKSEFVSTLGGELKAAGADAKQHARRLAQVAEKMAECVTCDEDVRERQMRRLEIIVKLISARGGTQFQTRAIRTTMSLVKGAIAFGKAVL